MVLDRGFYSQRNVHQILSMGHDVIGALPGRLKFAQRVLSMSTDIEDSRNLLRCDGEVLFAKEHKLDKLKIIVYHSPERRAREVQSFYTGLREVEEKLEELKTVKFPNKLFMLEELEGVCGDYRQ